MSAQHTPGPWTATLRDILPSDVGELACDLSAGGARLPGTEANRRLIEIAPKLLDALKDCLEAIGQDGVCDATCIACANARSLIAQVTGDA